MHRFLLKSNQPEYSSTEGGEFVGKMPSVFAKLHKRRYRQSDTVGQLFLSLVFTFQQLKSQDMKSIDI